MFPHELTDRRAFDIARVMMEGFDRHYRLFRDASRQAKRHFETGDWAAARLLAREAERGARRFRPPAARPAGGSQQRDR